MTGRIPAASAITQCGAFPALPVHTPAGTCLAVEASAHDGLRFPRGVLEVAPGRVWITDMGGWDEGRGRLLELSLDEATGRAHLRVLADHLDRPHGLALGPDGRVYVGEDSRLWRTDPARVAAPLVRETIADHLPNEGAHPLKALAAGPRGSDGAWTLYVNLGSASDACTDDDGRAPQPCPQTQGPLPRASVLAIPITADGQAGAPQVFATGLRNSVALFATQRGTVLQGENGIDYPEADQPPEALNVLRRGAFYGWPYCVGRTPARAYAGRANCHGVTAPWQPLPAHAAPLGFALAPANAVAGLAGRLLMSWHGYRPTGHRVVSWPLDAQDRPQGAPQPVLDGWDLPGADGVAQTGSPVGLAFDHQGRLWITEDRHKRVLVLMAASPRR